MITIQTECPDRKEMVRKLSDFLSAPAVYMRTPTYAFQIGNITVNRDASISGERDDLIPAMQFLLDNGYISELPTELNEASTDSIPAGDLKAEAVDEDLEAPAAEPIDRVCVYIPLGSCTPQGLCNIIRMVYARQSLITEMTRSSLISIDEEVVTLLDDSRPETIDQISELLKSETAAGMLHGIAVEDGKLMMDCAYDTEHPTGWNNFSRLLTAIADRAMKAHHVSGSRLTPEENEMKYFCRNWLIQLGMGGADHKEIRNALLDHLHGFAAFRTADKMDAHKAKYAEIRKAKRETDEENDHEAD